MTSVTMLLAAVDGDAVLKLFGRFHPALVHFPIALLAVAAVLESWQIVRRKPGMSPATPACVGLGAISAIAAAAVGWLWWFQEYGGTSSEAFNFDVQSWKTMDLHRWIGTGAAVVAIIGTLFVIKAASSSGALLGLRTFLFTGAALVGGTGYLGGDLVFGSNHLVKGIFDEPKVAKNKLPELAAVGDAPELVAKKGGDNPAAGPVDFSKDVLPILSENCIRCHGGEKVKGKLNFKTKAGMMAGGASGKAIEPGTPDKSLLYTTLIDTDPESKMPPPKEKQLTKEQVATIHKWIKEGATWPDGVEVK